jgi:hypothetical protein
VVDIPFEFVGEVSSAGAMAEARDVEGLASARHDLIIGREKKEKEGRIALTVRVRDGCGVVWWLAQQMMKRRKTKDGEKEVET